MKTINELNKEKQEYIEIKQEIENELNKIKQQLDKKNKN